MTDSDEDGDAKLPNYELREGFVAINKATAVPPEWVVDNLLPIGLTILCGPPKMNGTGPGKSTLTLAIAGRVAGETVPTLPSKFTVAVSKIGPALFFSAEAAAGDLRSMAEEQLRIRFCPVESIFVAKQPSDYVQPNARDALLDALDEYEPRLTVLDPWRNFHFEDENNSAAMYALLSPLRTWAIKHRASFLVVHHTTKLGKDQTDYSPENLRGSGAMFGLADGLIIMKPPRKGDPPYPKLQCIFKRGESWEEHVPLGVVQPTEQVKLKMTPAIKAVLDMLGAGIETPSVIAKALHREEKDILSVIAQLKQAGMWKASKL